MALQYVAGLSRFLNGVVDWVRRVLRVQVVGQNSVVGAEWHRLWDASDVVNSLGQSAAGGAGADVTVALPADIPAGGVAWLDVFNQSPDFGLKLRVFRKVTLSGAARMLLLVDTTVPKKSTAAGSELDGLSLPINGALAGDALVVRVYNDTAVGTDATNAHVFGVVRVV